jgi:hypothetical protein
MKKIEFTQADQSAAKVATQDVVANLTFWDQMQEQWEKMTSGPDIRPRQERPKSHTQSSNA